MPLPAAPFGNVIQDTVDVALHVQPVGAVTVIVRVPPTTLRLTGDTMMLHTAPACVTRTAFSAIVSVADRGEDVGFGVIVRPTMPAPDPPDVLKVIHETGDCAVQEQPRPAVTQTLLVALPPLTFTPVGVVE